MNTTPKPQKTLAGKSCPHCQQGKFELVQITHVERIAQDNPLTIPHVWVDQCTHCGEVLFPGDTTHYIETVVAGQTEQLTDRELERLREDFGDLTQDELSEVLGLGAKTYHKWESGAQYPSRSMCYYIRVLAEFPQAFDWLRRRAWRNQNRLAAPRAGADLRAMFPDLPDRMLVVGRAAAPAEPTRSRARNPATGLYRVAFLVK